MSICLKHFCGPLVGKPHLHNRGMQSFQAGGKNINPLYILRGGPAVKKPWREREEAQLYYLCGCSAPNAEGRVVVGEGRESCLRVVEISSVCIVCCFDCIPGCEGSTPPAIFQGQIPYHQSNVFER